MSEHLDANSRIRANPLRGGGAKLPISHQATRGVQETAELPACSRSLEAVLRNATSAGTTVSLRAAPPSETVMLSLGVG